MKFLRVSSLVLIAFALFQSCTSNFNPAAPYKNITVVYGLLSLSDSIHYIKIEKAFLSENGGNAYTEAQMPDSLYYPGGTLTVSLEDYSNGSLINSIPLTRVDANTLGSQKQNGIFASDSNIVYELPITATLNPNDSYTLVILNNKTGKTTTAQTLLVNSFYVSDPYPGLAINFLNGTNFNTEWQSAVNAEVYQVVLRFHYKEMQIGDTSNFHYDTLTWTFPSFSSTGQSNIFQTIPAKSFYTFVSSLVPANSNVERRALSFDFWFYAGGSAFYTYQQVSIASSSSLVYGQVNPSYTDVTNGIGLFSSTYFEPINGLPVFSQTLDSLASGSITGGLNFLNSKGVLVRP